MKTKVFSHSEQGLTLIETVIALFIFLIFLGFMIPLFSNQHISTINNEIDTGAVAVSQQILDKLRQANSATLPSTGSTNESVTAMGKQYSATITYCAVVAYCTTNARHIKVEVKHHGQTVYTVETAYTRLE